MSYYCNNNFKAPHEMGGFFCEITYGTDNINAMLK